MKLSIFPLLLAVFIYSCGETTAQNSGTKAATPPGSPVEFPRELNADFKKLGFVLPSQEIKAPNFILKDLSGTQRALESFQGKVIFLNFWGVWCYYCKIEMPSIQRLYDRLGGGDFEIVAVNVRDDEKTAREFIETNKHTFPVLLDTDYQA